MGLDPSPPPLRVGAQILTQPPDDVHRAASTHAHTHAHGSMHTHGSPPPPPTRAGATGSTHKEVAGGTNAIQSMSVKSENDQSENNKSENDKSEKNKSKNGETKNPTRSWFACFAGTLTASPRKVPAKYDNRQTSSCSSIYRVQ